MIIFLLSPYNWFSTSAILSENFLGQYTLDTLYSYSSYISSNKCSSLSQSLQRLLFGGYSLQPAVTWPVTFVDSGSSKGQQVVVPCPHFFHPSPFLWHIYEYLSDLDFGYSLDQQIILF